MKRDALKKLRKLFDQLIIFIPGNSLSPLHRVSNRWNTDSQMPGQFCERDAQFSDGPKAKKTPDLDFLWLFTFLKNVIWVCNEHPSITGRPGLRQEICRALKKIFAILIFSKYLSTLYPPDHEAMQNTGCPPATVNLRRVSDSPELGSGRERSKLSSI